MTQRFTAGRMPGCAQNWRRMNMPSNNAKTWTLISVILTVVGSVMVAAGIIIDEYNFYWMIFVGAVLAITFFI